MSRSGIAGSHGISMFNFLRKCQTVLHRGYTILHSHQQCMRVPMSPHPCQHLLVPGILTIAILVGVKRYLIVVLICITLTTNDVEHFSVFLLGICISSLEKYLFKSFSKLECLPFCC
uniref:Uncharacterized protein n=1 Tax=Equus caballus TaxID=9796 RepID=A0A9L0S7P1_HORSE